MLTRSLALLAALALSACATTTKVDQVQRVINVDKPVAVSCVPADYKRRPPSQRQTLKSDPDGPTRYADTFSAYVDLDAWADQADAILAACQKAAPTPAKAP